jgi:NADH-quinone oxidoreductase subunit J
MRAAIVACLVALSVFLVAAVAGAQQPAPMPPSQRLDQPAQLPPGVQVIRAGQPGAPAGNPSGRVQLVPVGGPPPGAQGPAPGQPVLQPGAPPDQAPAPAEQPTRPGKGSALVFWLFAALAVIGSIATITRRNAVMAAMCLVGTFIAISGVYLMLLAHFMAAIQVLVYAGAIMVLFVFVVMILNKEEEEPWALRGWFGKAAAGGALVYFLVRLVSVLWTVKGTMAEKPWRAGEFAAYGTTKAVGQQLFTSYLFPFEAISVALLIAILGAVVLAHPDHPAAQNENPGEGA